MAPQQQSSSRGGRGGSSRGGGDRGRGGSSRGGRGGGDRGRGGSRGGGDRGAGRGGAGRGGFSNNNNRSSSAPSFSSSGDRGRGRGFAAPSSSRGGRGGDGSFSRGGGGRGGSYNNNNNTRSASASHYNKNDRRGGATADNNNNNNAGATDLSPNREQLKQKVSHDIRRDLKNFFAKQHEITFESNNLEEVLAFIPQSMFIQHIPSELAPFRSYLPQFTRRSPNCGALGFIRWYEWATHMQQKLLAAKKAASNSNNTTSNTKNAPSAVPSNPDAQHDAIEKYKRDLEREAQKAATKTRLGDVMKQREHIRALLAMCHRPSAAGRRQGVHALLNHVKTLPIANPDILKNNQNDSDDHQQMMISQAFMNNISDLKEHVDATAAYGLTRLVLGMATESFSSVLFNCIALTSVLETLPTVSADLIYSLMDSELALTERMTAVFKRQDGAIRRLERGEDATEDEKARARKQIDEEPEEEGDEKKGWRSKINEQISDPSRGERQQKTMAALFTLVALWEAHNGSSSSSSHNQNKKQQQAKLPPLTTEHIRKMIQALCFLYIEHKGTRIVSSNLLFRVLAAAPKETLADRSTRRWLSVAFFSVPEIMYMRPEGIHMLLLLQHSYVMKDEYGDDVAVGGPCIAASTSLFPKAIYKLISTIDPLNPTSLEQYAVSLFRRDQVTSCHPMLHPVWDFFLKMITQRCAQGESLLQHLSNFLHNVVTPFRRGVTDVARQELFNNLIRQIGRLALQSADSDERASLIEVANKTVGFGKNVTIGKATEEATLRKMSPDELEQKVQSLGQQLASLGVRANVSRIRTWVLKELKATTSVPQFATVLPTFVNEGFQFLFDFGYFKSVSSVRASNFDSGNQNKAIYLVAEAVCYRALTLASKKGSSDLHKMMIASNHHDISNKNRLAFTTSYVDLLDRYLAQEKASKTRFTTVKASSPVRKARSMVEKAIRENANSNSTNGGCNPARSVLFYKQDDLIDGLLFLLFLTLSTDDPQNNFINDLATSIVPDLIRFLSEGKIESINLLFDVLMALNMRDSAPEQISPVQVYIRRLCQRIMCHFARFLKTKEDFDLILGPLINAFDVDLAQQQRKLDLEKKKKKLEKLGVDASTSGVVQDDEDEDEDEDDDLLDDEAENEDDASNNKKKKNSSKKKDDEGTEADETEEDDDDEETDEDDEDEVAGKSENAEDSDDDNIDDDAAKLFDDVDDDEWEQEGEDAPTAEYLNRLKALLKKGNNNKTSARDEDNEDEDEDEDKDGKYLDEVTLHVYAPVPANKAETDVINAINVANKITQLSKTPSALRTFQVLLGVMRETLKLPRSQEVFIAAENAIQTLMVSLPRFCGSFLDEKSSILLGLLRDLVSYCRRVESTMLHQLNKEKEKKEETDGGHGNRNFIEMAAMLKHNLYRLKRLALRVFHYSAMYAHKNFASEAVRLLFLEHYKSIFADRGWDMKRIIGSLKHDMFHYRQAFAWCFLDAAVEKLESVRLIKAVRRARSYMDCSQFITAFIPRLSRLPPSLLSRAQGCITKFFTAFASAKELYKVMSILVYELIKTLQFAAEYQKYTAIDTKFAKSIADEVVNDDEIRITAATRRSLAKLERALGITGTGQRAQNTKQVEPFLALKKSDAQHHPQVENPEDLGKSRKNKHSSKSQRAEASIVAKRFLKDRAVEEGQNLPDHTNTRDANTMSSSSSKNNNNKKSHRGENESNPHQRSSSSNNKPLDPNSKAARKLEEQRKRQEEWEQLPTEEKKAIRAKKQQAKQDRVSENRKHRREHLQQRDKKVASWREEKLEKAANVYDQL